MATLTIMKRVIVADDDPQVRTAIRSVLASRGFAVIESSNGLDVLSLPDLGSFDLLITDIVMPEIEGTDLVMRVRRDHPHLPILALTGSAYAEAGDYLKVAQLLGASRTMAKPFRASELMQAVRELVGE